jgi:hypothetical protein
MLGAPGEASPAGEHFQVILVANVPSGCRRKSRLLSSEHGRRHQDGPWIVERSFPSAISRHAAAGFVGVAVEGGARIWRMIMIKRVLIAAVVFATPACLVSARDAKVSVDMIGIGGMSCAHWLSTNERLLEGTVWIYGFWTGLNYVAVASDQPQSKIDLAAIVPEVKKMCGRQTSQTLASAVWSTYLGSQK